MRIGLVDVDGHNFPNLALMKLSAWHKCRGDTVEFADPAVRRYDKVYMSKVFTFFARLHRPLRLRGRACRDGLQGLCDDSSRRDRTYMPGLLALWGQRSLWVSHARMREPLFVVRRAP